LTVFLLARARLRKNVLRMLRTIIRIALCILISVSASAQHKIGDNTLVLDPASILELESTSQGFLPSRMTTTQRDAQTEWDEGHIIYNITDNCLQIYNGTSWDCLVQGVIIDSTIYKFNGSLISDRIITLAGNNLTFDGSSDDIVITSEGNLGIGDPSPEAKLDVEGGTVRLSDYGIGMINGAESYLLGVDSDGDVIEVSPTIDTFLFSSDTLFLSLRGDREAAKFAKLPSLAINTDNQIIDQFAIDGSDLLSLSIENDDIPPLTVNLSSYRQTLSKTGDNITLSGGGDTVKDDHLGTSDQTLNENRDVLLNGSSIDFRGAEGRFEINDNGNFNVFDDTTPLISVTDLDDDVTTRMFSTATEGVIGTNTPHTLNLRTDNNNVGSFDVAGLFTLNNYGVGTFTGTSVSLLGVESSGDVIEVDQSTFIQDLSLTGTTLALTGDASTVDLGPFLDNTDNQIVDQFDLAGNTIRLSLENDDAAPITLDLSPILGDSSTNIYNTSASLEANRTVTMSGNSLTFDGSSRDIRIASNGFLGVGVTSPARPLHVDEALRISRGSNSTSFIFDRYDGSISNTWKSFLMGVNATSDGNGEFYIADYNENVSGGGFSRMFTLSDPTEPIRFDQYDGTTFVTGNEAALLGVEPDGDIVEVDISSVGSNIYNTNDNLESDRTVTMDGNTLTFDGTGTGDVIIEEDGDVGIGTVNPRAKLEVDGGTVLLDEYGAGTQEDDNAEYLLGVDAEGNVVELPTAQNSRWFYAPAFTVDASSLVTDAQIDLHQEYVDQFTSIPSNLRSPGAPSSLPTYAEDELDYIVTFFDNSVMDNITVSAEGILLKEY